MVKDVSDSKRTNANIEKHQTEVEARRDASSNEMRQTRSSARLRNRAQRGSESPFIPPPRLSKNVKIDEFSAIIVSKQFWPTLHGEELAVHPSVKSVSDRFSHAYHVLKNPRKVVWKYNLGTVMLDLEFDDGQTRSYTVSTCLATMIMHVAEQDSINLEELSRVMEIESGVCEKRMGFWVNQGVVEKSINVSLGKRSVVYTSVKKLSEDHEKGVIIGEEQGAQSAVSADVQLAEEMAVYESYVTGMLMNHEALPAERIHNILKMVLSAGEHKYDKSIEELKSFLNKLVHDEKIEYANDSYLIKKS